MEQNVKNYITGSALGAASGILGGGIYNVLTKKKLLDPTALLIGASAGGLAGVGYARHANNVLNDRKANDARKKQQIHNGKMDPGVYYCNNTFFASDPYLKNISFIGPKFRHSFITVVSNEPKKGDDNYYVKMDNGQYTRTYELANDHGRWCALVNRDSDSGGRYSRAKEESVLHDRFNGYIGQQKNDLDYDIEMHPLGISADKVNEALDILDVHSHLPVGADGRRGEFDVFASPKKKLNGNCNQFASSLLSHLDFDRSKLPRMLGRWGGVHRNDIDKWSHLSDPNIQDASKPLVPWWAIPTWIPRVTRNLLGD